MFVPSDKAVRNTKIVAELIVGTSVGWVTKEIIENNVDPETRADKAKARIGGMAAGSMAAAHTRRWLDKKIDHWTFEYEKLVAKINHKEDQK